MFADQAGADGTSIWAAATSGQHAIGMHLLSCMLARIWKPAEATSLWVELVERRKQEIFKGYDSSSVTGISAIMAAQQLFNREQFSAWDASARSWLQTADTTKRFQQTQLMLILNNVHMPVNTSRDPYDSIISAWKSGMNAMENLLQVVPQRVQDGAILLAISSWHLYPNMQVLSDLVRDIDMSDDLMNHSILTISTSGASDSRDGVFWSLPLSRMRYYSPAVISERSLASDTSRITMEEFQVVFLGAFVAQWKTTCSDEIRCCKIIARIYRAYQGLPKGQNRLVEIPQWFSLIAAAAHRVLHSSGQMQAQHVKLLKLGSRRCGAFLHEPGYNPPGFFGLEYYHILVRVLKDTEARISLLRRAAARRNMNAQDLVIRYKTDQKTSYRYASVIPHSRTSRKRSADAVETPSSGHKRFAIGRYHESDVCCYGEEACGCTDPTITDCFCRDFGAKCTLACHPNQEKCFCPDPPVPVDCQGDCAESHRCIGCYNQDCLRRMEVEGEEISLIHPASQDVVDEYQFRLRWPGGKDIPTYGLAFGHGILAAVYQSKAAVTYDTYNQSLSSLSSATIEEIESVVFADSFDPSSLELETCCDHWVGDGMAQTLCSLEALVFASRLYASMADTTVSIEVMAFPMYKSAWARSFIHSRQKMLPCLNKGMWWHSNPDDEVNMSENKESLYEREAAKTFDGSSDHLHDNDLDDESTSDSFGNQQDQDDMAIHQSKASYNFDFTEADDDNTRHYMGIFENKQLRSHRPGSKETSGTLSRSFACIAWFDSGEFDLPVSQLNAVMALANGDSIYVASALLSDPSVSTRTTPITRVFGNLGRSEMSLLVPPADPRLAEPDLSAWKHIDHSEFTGQLQDCFSSTSLHLTFTDSEDNAYLGNRGLRDRQVVFLEALVSIDDRGIHIGDLDILSMFSKLTFEVQSSCSHTPEERATVLYGCQLIAIDNWDEFLDPPESAAIFRADGNWQARLGAAAAATQMGKHVFVLSPEKPCLQCLGTTKIDIIVA
ncbi:hypothetical protein HBI38_030200 [Parastagonospora nodorum]|nr:hypothetical protein HBH74_224550 [Parastagonospora nodorum]KAH4991163.1 hypothetical protein HBH73_017870 [Parastagonospora nodorum]KAH5095648.1 hypothetical protein HBH72_148580 [Parastagonospora nodorum]KAH5166234.1 hypothetical protein HBI73_025490 [Parastagonospora nodorum]KAH5310274.1 hypothetical protein HBI50_164400 [Parastagonospora nodorum]